jgi:hypothetical protein
MLRHAALWLCKLPSLTHISSHKAENMDETQGLEEFNDRIRTKIIFLYLNQNRSVKKGSAKNYVPRPTSVADRSM